MTALLGAVALLCCAGPALLAGGLAAGFTAAVARAAHSTWLLALSPILLLAALGLPRVRGALVRRTLVRRVLVRRGTARHGPTPPDPEPHPGGNQA